MKLWVLRLPLHINEHQRSRMREAGWFIYDLARSNANKNGRYAELGGRVLFVCLFLTFLFKSPFSLFSKYGLSHNVESCLYLQSRDNVWFEKVSRNPMTPTYLKPKPI